ADFEYEFEMALMNRKLAPDIDVVCLMTDIRYQFVRASLIKEVARLGGDIEGLAPANVIAALKQKYDQS
ncbi:MAG: pantetheine-phosphate adenylyltransferase, partial [Chloroflexi bacterium]|nr:pantetheine-phosphate adenylyltransferase [Chloroflexota bacterium]